jgi:two-component system, OmpR family, response regulator VicR
MSRKILIVDDEHAIVDILKYNLEKDGFETVCAYDGNEGLRLTGEADPDLILLDVMLPEIDGFQVCRTLREQGNNVPIIMITAREEETDKVFGLELGADDYITKPFSMREVVARVRTNMRRAAALSAPVEGADSAAVTVRELTLDEDRHVLYKNGRELELTQREYELIRFLIQNPGKVVSREELMTQVWQYEYFGDLRAVDVAVRRLREKLEDNPAEPTYVVTKRGAGYYFAG